MTVRAMNEHCDEEEENDDDDTLPTRAMSASTMYGDDDKFDDDDDDHHHSDDSVLPLHLYLSIVQFQRPVRHDLPHTHRLLPLALTLIWELFCIVFVFVFEL